MNAKYNKLDGYRGTGGECCCTGQIRRSVHRIKHGREGWGEVRWDGGWCGIIIWQNGCRPRARDEAYMQITCRNIRRCCKLNGILVSVLHEPISDLHIIKLQWVISSWK